MRERCVERVVLHSQAAAQALRFNLLHNLRLDVCVKYSSGFRVAHGLCHFGFNNLSGCLFLLDHYRLMQSFLSPKRGLFHTHPAL